MDDRRTTAHGRRAGRSRRTGVVLVAHPSPELYGSDRMLVESVRALVGAGRRVVVVLPSSGPLVPLLASAGADVRVLPTLVLRKALLRPRGLVTLVALALRTAPGMLREVRRERPDVVLVNTVTLPLWLLVGRAAGRRTVCHVHEAEELPRLLSGALNAPLLLAHRVVVNSAAAGDVVARALPLLRRRVRLVYNGVPGPARTPEPPREQLAGAAELLLLGRLSPRKGTDVAVEAVAELGRRGAEVRLTLVGDVFPGYEWFREQLQALVADAGLQRVVRFVPFQDDVWPWLSRADVVLVPSRVEPFGNVAVEAALAWRPVVASAVQGLREIVDSGRTGLLVPPDDPVALADGIAGLLRDWPTARDLAARSRAEAERRFSPSAYGAGLLDVLGELDRPRRRRGLRRGPADGRRPPI